MLRKAGLHVAETAAPALGFTVAYATTGKLPLSLAAALCLAALVALHRFRQARSIWPALGGLCLAALAGALATLSGEAADYFLPLIAVRTVIAVATPVLMLLRLPPAGLVTGLVTGRGLSWRRCPVRLRAFTIVNALWLAMEASLLANQLRLYHEGQAVAMGVFKLLVEVPAHLVAAVVLWLLYRRLTDRPCRGPLCPDHLPSEGEARRRPGGN
ncbi:DUF3159 domain-containing protein [Nonomuraea sp. SMC257]|uniref:DUF3159 domain-containing protein n=1 Tax=Nonomuraea montanisoli TaxID=2741721 RepID=A0A7Y6IKC2_9ACTN|nr:DUF3159 domain-containing protein [Nonomuraea montanisoli]NUW38439.1 DUF3159 domain-containing protein [Nonomuraea montanisoli]